MEVTSKKSLSFRERWAVAASDSTYFQELVRYRNGEEADVAFDFIPWIHELEGGLPRDISFDRFARTVRDKFSSLTPKIEVFVANGAWGEPQDPAENFERLITFSITGYDKGTPRLTVVKFYIDWSTKTVLYAYFMPIKLGPVESGIDRKSVV